MLMFWLLGVGCQQVEFLSDVAAVTTRRAEFQAGDRVERVVAAGQLEEVLRRLKLQLFGRLELYAVVDVTDVLSRDVVDQTEIGVNQ